MAAPNAEIEALKRQLAERDLRQAALEAQLATLTQIAMAKSEPERVAALEKEQLAKKRKVIQDEALEVARAMAKGKEKITHLRYVTGQWYQRKGTNYPPGTVLKIPVEEEPSVEWKAWKRPVITRPTAIDPDAVGTPFSEVRSSPSAIADLKRSELAGDTVIAGRAPPAAENVSVPETEEQPAGDQATEPTSDTRASDTDVG